MKHIVHWAICYSKHISKVQADFCTGVHLKCNRFCSGQASSMLDRFVGCFALLSLNVAETRAAGELKQELHCLGMLCLRRCLAEWISIHPLYTTLIPCFVGYISEDGGNCGAFSCGGWFSMQFHRVIIMFRRLCRQATMTIVPSLLLYYQLNSFTSRHKFGVLSCLAKMRKAYPFVADGSFLYPMHLPVVLGLGNRSLLWGHWRTRV